GGDGTAMEVAGALAFGPTPIGVLAGGTGNLVARALGIPMRVERAVPALRAVLRREFFQARIEADGEVIERRAAAVLFANFGAILENRISFGPEIAVDDGMLDCCVFSPTNLRDAMRIMWRVTRRDFRPDPSILYRKGTRFRLETDPVLTLQAAGELLGPTPAEVTVQPLAVQLLVPRRRREP